MMQRVVLVKKSTGRKVTRVIHMKTCNKTRISK